jgi:hypothetical protein
VKLTALREGSTDFREIGNAIQRSAGEWRLVWDTTGVAPGTYKVRALANAGDKTGSSAFVTVTVAETVTTVATATNQTVEQPKVATTTPRTLEPPIVILFPTVGTARGLTDLTITVPDAYSVDIYARPINALTPRYVGRARPVSDTEWLYRWDTTNTPNGDYLLFARVTHAYGTTDSARATVVVANELVPPTNPDDAATHTEFKAVFDTITKPTPSTTVELVIPTTTPLETLVSDQNSSTDVTSRLPEYRANLTRLLDAYARAVRAQNKGEQDRITAEMSLLKEALLTESGLTETDSSERQALLALLEQHTQERITQLNRFEEIIRDRLAERALVDSDSDGIPDFDEINLYQTQPRLPDTDGDGVLDGDEVKGGFNPRAADPAALVRHELPLDSGVIREDILAVENIITAVVPPSETGTTTTTRPRAIITGRGLPNSFVTVYIFSTPVIVTVKTNADGRWSYVFEKDLEDGEHQVVVALTDNEGSIVAKSEPLAFVKTAEAFSPVTAESQARVVTAEAPELLDEENALVYAALIVVALGLLLIILGFFADRRRHLVAP